jgi:plastocyanin
MGMRPRSVRRRVVAVLLSGVVAALLLGPAAALAAEVGMTNTSFVPSLVKIKDGGKVVWTNGSGVRHNVKGTSSNWPSGKITLDPGERASIRFRKAGRYTYTCTLHGGMDGTVRVR